VSAVLGLQVISPLAQELCDQRETKLQAITLLDLLSERDAMLAAQAMYFI